jgi:D-arginine dehydrogenase
MAASKAYDFLIIGAGIAGVSLAYRIGNRARVLVVEAESQPGYHSSGRSAAMYMETYGTPTIRAMTRASRNFFQSPPDGFSSHALLKNRGVLYLVREDQVALKEEILQQLQATAANVGWISADAVLARVPCVKADGLIGAIEEPEAKDVDVHALLQGFLKGARQAGTELTFGTTITDAVREGEHWNVRLSNGQHVLAGAVINAAGAWAQRVADQFGAINVGLQPKRRSAFTFKPVCEGRSDPFSAEIIERWPAVVGIDESFYFKPDAGQLLGSSANADPVDPHDVVAEELDVALGIDRITTATTLEIRRPTHTWAGLRSFVEDGDFVIGWDAKVTGFFWLAGQGGYGIQTSPGASLLASNLLLGEPIDVSLATEGVDAANVSPVRFHVLDQ